ncbi:hypothetical protein [Streptomyces sp. NRRL F-5123]|uniref:hypothetical protein n=1 Tax=Streptomyces sp. NRRL F-5123 TaxID=1463856 RepID=UPI0004E14080|nr:hypothetical protein [Streptomyces sp. NRRL F-5123]
MGFPPPPPHNGPPPPPDQGGGFGPPQGFGPPPPPPPNDGYGYPQQGGGFGPPGPPGPPAPPGGGYGYPGDGGYGGPPQGGGYGGPPQGGGFGQGGYGPGGFPPPPPPNNTKRNVWIAVGAVVVVGAIIGIAVAAGGGDGDKKPSAKDTTSISMPTATHLPTDIPSPTFSLPTDFPSLDLPTDLPSDDSSDEPDPSASDSQDIAYIVVDPGKCFNAPSMTHTIDEVQVVSCTTPHDAQSVATKTLSGTFASEQDIQDKAFDLCKADAKAHAPADGKEYYEYVLYPQLVTYEIQGRKTVTCALSINDGTNGKKLTKKLA